MSLIDITIPSREKDIGGFNVGRLLPYSKRRMVGPFAFVDHMGPVDFVIGDGLDVRPHPHIGLATVTYLFSGEMMHRDSIGSQQSITAGAVNWMTAGRGIAHSERTDPLVRAKPQQIHGLQSWVALPKEFEEMAPEFHHHTAETLPCFDIAGVELKLIAGSAYGYEAPVKIFSALFYVEVKMQAGATLKLPQEYRERALYIISGSLRAGTDIMVPKTMPVFASDDNIVLEALMPTHFVLLGGEPLGEPRFMDWNFVSSSQERLEQARQDWKNGRFGKVTGDEVEFIPQPEK